MTTRADLYQQFGPQLLEAIALIALDEINALRKKANLPERTPQQFMDAIQTRLDTLALHPWQTAMPPP